MVLLELESSQIAGWRPPRPSPTSRLLHVAWASGPGLAAAQLLPGLSRTGGKNSFRAAALEASRSGQPRDLLGSWNPREHSFWGACFHATSLHPPPLESGRCQPRGPATCLLPYPLLSHCPSITNHRKSSPWGQPVPQRSLVGALALTLTGDV